MPGEAARFATAWQALTRAPAAGAWPPEVLRHAATVGLLVGALGAAVLWAAAHLWPATVAVGLALAAMAAFTAAGHERGLAAACDGNERLGAAGLVALMAVLALKAAALHALALRDLAGVLVMLPVAHALSRGLAALLVVDAPAGASRPLVLAVMGLAAAGAVAAGWGVAAVAVAAAAALAVALAVVRAVRVRGGGAGAAFGAAQQGSELALWLALLAARTQG